MVVMGGGFTLVAGTDLRAGAERAIFKLSEAKLAKGLNEHGA